MHLMLLVLIGSEDAVFFGFIASHRYRSLGLRGTQRILASALTSYWESGSAVEYTL